ncbi:MAG: DUF4124 domain-containing protein [Hylemonella sp.]
MKRLLLLLLTLTAAPVFGQWHWIDLQGRSVFSDQPPPAGIPEKNIRRQPGAARPAVPGSDKTMAPETEPSRLPVPTGEDKALQAKRRQAEQAESAKQQAEQERIARQQAENCQRARLARVGLDAGGRIARVNEKGEREFLDESGIAAERQRIDAMVASDCQ